MVNVNWNMTTVKAKGSLPRKSFCTMPDEMETAYHSANINGRGMASSARSAVDWRRRWANMLLLLCDEREAGDAVFDENGVRLTGGVRRSAVEPAVAPLCTGSMAAFWD